METNISNLESLEFWERVKEEYSSYYICISSVTFCTEWYFGKVKIKLLGSLFMNELEVKGFYIDTHRNNLFMHDDNIDGCYPFKTGVDIRKAFINWNIKRLKNK